MTEKMNFAPPFEVGEYIDIKLRVYLDKKASDKGEHFAEPYRVASGVSHQMNESYKEFQDRPYWQSGKIWFAPIKYIKYDERDDLE